MVTVAAQPSSLLIRNRYSDRLSPSLHSGSAPAPWGPRSRRSFARRFVARRPALRRLCSTEAWSRSRSIFPSVRALLWGPACALVCQNCRLVTHSPGCLLDDLGVMRVRGPDARAFLQGQLSNDIERLSQDTLLRASLNTPQGRALALMGLVASDSDVLAVMPRELIANISTLLKRYVLRSKVTLADDSAAFRIVGLQATDATAPGLQPGQLCRYGFQADQRILSLQPASSTGDFQFGMSRDTWRALDIAAG